jgi:hypothetical protein
MDLRDDGSVTRLEAKDAAAFPLRLIEILLPGRVFQAAGFPAAARLHAFEQDPDGRVSLYGMLSGGGISKPNMRRWADAGAENRQLTTPAAAMG